MLSGFSTSCHGMVLVYLRKNCSLVSSALALVFLVLTSLDAQFMFAPHLQDGKKIPKWDSRAQQGIFLGFSPRHLSSVPLILNPRTQHISPQFHVIFDNSFSTVPSLATANELDHRFEQLFATARECFLDSSDISSSSDLLDDHWLSPSDLEQCLSARQRDLLWRTPCLQSSPDSPPFMLQREFLLPYCLLCRHRPHPCPSSVPHLQLMLFLLIQRET